VFLARGESRRAILRSGGEKIIRINSFGGEGGAYSRVLRGSLRLTDLIPHPAATRKVATQVERKKLENQRLQKRGTGQDGSNDGCRKEHTPFMGESPTGMTRGQGGDGTNTN